MSKLLALLLALAATAALATPRSELAKEQFALKHACPSTHKHKLPCPGYVIDHIKPLDCGGADSPTNMQWQTIKQGKAKDQWERNGPSCKHRTHNPLPMKGARG